MKNLVFTSNFCDIFTINKLLNTLSRINTTTVQDEKDNWLLQWAIEFFSHIEKGYYIIENPYELKQMFSRENIISIDLFNEIIKSHYGEGKKQADINSYIKKLELFKNSLQNFLDHSSTNIDEVQQIIAFFSQIRKKKISENQVINQEFIHDNPFLF